MRLGDVVERAAQEWSDRPAIIFGDESITYSELDRTINRVANGLIELGVRPGDRVAIQVTNRPQFIEAFYGVARAGAIVVPVNVMYKTDEIAYLLGDSAATAYIALEPFYPLVAAARDRAPALKEVVVIGAGTPAGAIDWGRLAGHANDRRPALSVAETDPAVICYTSGTTGRAQEAMLSHRNLIYNCHQCDQLANLRVRPEDRALLVLPLFHIYSLNVGMNPTFYKGGAVVLMERFDPVGSLDAIEKHGVSLVYGAPPMYIAWVGVPGLERSRFPNLRTAASGAAALPVSILERFREQTGVTIAEGYGLTETSPVATTNSAAPAPKPARSGCPCPAWRRGWSTTRTATCRAVSPGSCSCEATT